MWKAAVENEEPCARLHPLRKQVQNSIWVFVEVRKMDLSLARQRRIGVEMFAMRFLEKRKVREGGW